MWLFWILLIVAVVLLVRGLASSRGGDTGSTDALEVLRRRFARGEIDEAEFERRKRRLQS